jgi:cytochrome oxidase Cu insertion factor (SCO1/SenC/PrrC family)
MKTNREVALSFSGGKFEDVADYVAENVEWNVYEEKMSITGKSDVLKFCRSVAEYFKSVTTKFEMFGIVADDTKVAIYGRAEFIRESKTVNIVHSCDVYEFDAEGKILKIYSYCNSKPVEQ